MATDLACFNLTPVDVPVPGILPRAFGYEGDHSWLACWWEPAGDEFHICDGAIECDGAWAAWLAYRDHVAVFPALAGYNLGSSDVRAEHALLFDLESHAAYIGRLRNVRRFLHAQYPPPEIPSEQMKDFLAAVNQAMREAMRQLDSRDPSAVMAEVHAQLAKEAEVIDELRRALDSMTPDAIACVICDRPVPRADAGFPVSVHIAHLWRGEASA